MSKSLSLLVYLVAFLGIPASQGMADDAVLTQLKADAATALSQRDAAATEFQAAAAQLRTKEQMLLKAKRELDQANKQVKENQEALPKQQEALTKATEPKTAAEKGVAEATKAFDDANKAVEEAGKAIEESTKDVQAATNALTEGMKGVEAATKAVEEATKTNDAKQIEDAKKALDEKKKGAEDLKKALDEKKKVLDDRNKALGEKKKAVEDRKKAVDEKKKALEATVKPFADAEAVVKKSNETIAAAQQTITKSNETIAKLDPEVTALKAKVPQLEAAAKSAREGWVAKQKGVEAHLKGLNQWVSFSHEVAPIFYQRCLACHNARMAKGRFNMENYAAIMKGGESGAAIEPGKTDCNLCTQIGDGSMPQDADPLTKEQIALVNKWVQLGAQVDAGIEPTAALIRIMPKFAQPPAPEAYKVPIPVTAVAISPDGKLLASGGYHEVILWNIPDGTVARRIGNVAERVHQLIFSADGQRIVLAGGTPGQAGEAKVFNVADGALLADLVTTEDSVFSVAFNPDGTRLATCGADRSIRIFDVATWKELVLIEDHADWVMDVAWSHDGKRLASASRDKTSKVFDAATGDGIATFSAHADSVYTVGFLADNEHVISGGNDKQLRVWKISDAKQVRNMGLGGEVFRLKMLPGNKVVCCSADKTARIYDATNGQQAKNFQGSKEWLYSVDYLPAAGKIVTGSYDGEIRLWKFEDQQVEKSWIGSPGYTPPQTAAK